MDGASWSIDRSLAVWPPGEIEERLVSTFDVEKIRGKCGKVEGVELRSSDAVGNYLCAFVYYTTLAWYETKEKGGERPVLFLHVPVCSTGEHIIQGRDVTIEIIKSMVAVWLARKDKAGKRQRVGSRAS